MGPLYDPLGLSDCSAVPTRTTFSSHVDCQICRIRLALPILPHQVSPKTCCSELSSFCHEGASQVSLRHLLAFHASWYYRLFIQLLFKVDADRVALDMCIAKEMLTVILNTFICRNILFFLRVSKEGES